MRYRFDAFRACTSFMSLAWSLDVDVHLVVVMYFSLLTIYMVVSIVMGYPNSWMVCKEKSQSQMDDD